MTKEKAKQWIKDLISTMKLETSGLFPDAPYEDEVYEALEIAIEALEQEPRKGEWTKISNVVPCMNCPICGSTFTLILGGDKMHYCPNCGAKMESEE